MNFDRFLGVFARIYVVFDRFLGVLDRFLGVLDGICGVVDRILLVFDRFLVVLTGLLCFPMYSKNHWFKPKEHRNQNATKIKKLEGVLCTEY